MLTDVVRAACALILLVTFGAAALLALDAHRRGLTRLRRIRLERPTPTVVVTRRASRRHVRRVRGW